MDILTGALIGAVIGAIIGVVYYFVKNRKK